MARSMGFRLLVATLVAGLAATPALAGKKKAKKKKKAKTEQSSNAAKDGARVAGPAPPAKRMQGKQTIRGPGKKKRAGKRGKRRAGQRKGQRGNATVRGPNRNQNPRAGGPSASTKPRVQARPASPSKPRAQESKPRLQGAKPGARAPGSAHAGTRPRVQQSSPRVRGGTPDRKPRAQSGPRMQSATPGGAMMSTPQAAKPKRTVRIQQSVLLPDGWTPQAHRYHETGGSGQSAAPPGAGVFTYNPPPKRHNVQVVKKNPVTGSSTCSKLPSRDVDRRNSFAVGVKGGTLVEQEASMSELSGDTGYGIVARYRPLEAIGFEGSWMRHEDASSGALVRDPLSVSAQLFAFPWTRVSPYIGGGVTIDGPASSASAPASGRRMAPHAGLGVELAIGRSLAIDIEGRYLSQMQNLSDDPLKDGGALQATAGLLFHF